MKSYRAAIPAGQVRALFTLGLVRRGTVAGSERLPHCGAEATSCGAMTTRPRIFSGMQPTGSGELHLGNYLGALKNWVELVEEGQHEALFCVVDAHAATVEYDPKKIEQMNPHLKMVL